MKIGDLVKHPKGIENVCKVMYGMGIVLELSAPRPGFMNQVMVSWDGESPGLFYYEDQLEVISENR